MINAKLRLRRKRLGIRGKSILLAVIASLIIISYFVFYSLPIQKQRITSSFTRIAQSQVHTLATIIVSPILKKKYASVYEIFDSQLKDNPNWLRLTFVNNMGQVMFPLTQNNEMIKKEGVVIKKDVLFLDENLGKIILVANYSSEIEFAKTLQYKLIFMLIAILFILLMMSLFFIERTFTKPLSVLSSAFDQVSQQNFNSLLPELRNDEMGDIIYDFSIMRDNIAQYQHELITLKNEAERSNKELLVFSHIFTDAHDGITITDSDSLIIDVNPTFSEITGYSREEVIGQNPSILSSGQQDPEFYADMWMHIHEKGYWQGEIWNRKKSGELYAELLSISTLKDSKGKALYYLGLFSDITKSKKQQEKLELLAHYDALTKLPNRTLFSDRFSRAVAHSKRSQTLLAVCFLDLDHFKPVNDDFGHDIGDELLIEVAQRIKDCIREEDTVSRQGGDEFAILLGDIETVEQCQKMLERLHHSLAQPYCIEEHTHRISASSGITLFPIDNSDIDALVRHADQAMYQAKMAGRNRYHFFDAHDEQSTMQKYHKIDEIQHALINNELQLYYQPKINMRKGTVFGAEALLRWLHPKKGLISPLDFLPLIDATDLELQIGDWVINQALQQMTRWLTQGIKLEISVNIASHHLQSPLFIDNLEHALAKYPNVNPMLLQLEILESSALGDLQNIKRIIKKCQEELGVSVALDDFGTGYSSLTHLRNLPISTIKIDQSFIRNMLEDPNDVAIIDGILGLVASFHREVIAEGVETVEHGLMLLMMGCYNAQGYGIARPMPANDFPQWLADYRPHQEWLDCGNREFTLKEMKIKLFKLALTQWFIQFNTGIQASPNSVENWPIMIQVECLCGYWLQRAKQENLFDDLWLNKLELAHELIHNIANELLAKYQRGHIDEAKNGLGQVRTAFNEIVDILDHP